MITLSEYNPEGYRSAFDSLYYWGGMIGASTVAERLQAGLYKRAVSPLVELSKSRYKFWLRKAESEGPAAATKILQRFAEKKAGTKLGAAYAQVAANLTKASESPILAFNQGLKGLSKLANLAFTADILLTVGEVLGRALSAPRLVPAQLLSEAPRASWAGGPAYTQRQRALAAIHNSQLTTRAIFGNEAAYLH